MARQATGEFEVKLSPQTADESPIGRMTIDKVFHGGIEGTSAGQMLAFRTAMPGSAGYVAMERVTGSLDGREGSFVLQHSGSMNRGEPRLQVTVVPDSGTGALTGLSGSMNIVIAPGKHSYEFEYEIAANPADTMK